MGKEKHRDSMKIAQCILGITATLLVGCASQPPKVPPLSNVTEGRVNSLENEVKDMKSELNKVRAAIDSLAVRADGAPSKQEIRRLNQALDDLAKRHSPRSKMKTSSNLPIKKLSPPVNPGGSETESVIEEAAAEPLDFSEEETLTDSKHEGIDLYYRGLDELKKKNFSGAVRSFREFLKEHPQHVYSDRAEFQIAKAHYLDGEYGLVIVATNLLETRHPNSFQIPEAMYHRALAFEGLRQTKQAVQTLDELLKRYPSVPIAGEASRKIAELSVSQKNEGPDNVPLMETATN